MTKLVEITAAMHIYNNTVSPASECAAWQDYVTDCYVVMGHAPWAEWQDSDGNFQAAANLDAPSDFTAYWLDVAESES